MRGSRKRTVYFSDIPTESMGYAFEPDNGVYEIKDGIPVLFEFDRKLMPRVRKSRVGFATGTLIPANSIQRIFIFDQRASEDFPFQIMTREEFLEWIDLVE